MPEIPTRPAVDGSTSVPPPAVQQHRAKGAPSKRMQKVWAEGEKQDRMTLTTGRRDHGRDSPDKVHGRL